MGMDDILARRAAELTAKAEERQKAEERSKTSSAAHTACRAAADEVLHAPTAKEMASAITRFVAATKHVDETPRPDGLTFQGETDTPYRRLHEVAAQWRDAPEWELAPIVAELFTRAIQDPSSLPAVCKSVFAHSATLNEVRELLPVFLARATSPPPPVTAEQPQVDKSALFVAGMKELKRRTEEQIAEQRRLQAAATSATPTPDSAAGDGSTRRGKKTKQTPSAGGKAGQKQKREARKEVLAKLMQHHYEYDCENGEYRWCNCSPIVQRQVAKELGISPAAVGNAIKSIWGGQTEYAAACRRSETGEDEIAPKLLPVYEGHHFRERQLANGYDIEEQAARSRVHVAT